MSLLRSSLEVRFDAKVFKSDECWIWTGALNSKGYGLISDAGKLHLAHRVSYERFVDAIPAGLAIDHTCSRRRCVRPDHLDAVTTGENNRRALERKYAREPVIPWTPPARDPRPPLTDEEQERLRIAWEWLVA